MSEYVAGVTGSGEAGLGRHPYSRLRAPVLATLAVAFGLVLIYTLGGRSTSLINQSVITGLLLGGVYALVSIGLTLIFGVLGVVNFAHGAMLTLSMYIVYWVFSLIGVPVYLGMVASAFLMFGFGYLIQRSLLNRLVLVHNSDGPLLITLGLSLLIINVILMIFGGRPLSVPSPVEGSFRILGAVASYERVIACAGAAIVAVAVTVMLRRTTLGRAIRAVAANSQGASLVGIHVGRVYALTFGVGAACVGIAGGLMAPFLSLTPTVGEEFTILAFVIAVLGGLGSIAGAVFGGVVIGVVQTVGSLYLPGTGSLILVFAVFILVLLFRPQGLFGATR